MIETLYCKKPNLNLTNRRRERRDQYMRQKAEEEQRERDEKLKAERENQERMEREQREQEEQAYLERKAALDRQAELQRGRCNAEAVICQWTAFVL